MCFVYRKFSKDVWGLGLLGVPYSNPDLYKRVTKFFFRMRQKARDLWKFYRMRYVYRLDVALPKGRRKRMKKSFASIRLVKFFYLILTYKHFKAMARGARKKDGYFEGHYCLALEGRLITFLYRTGFVATMFEALRAVKSNFVTVNKRLISYPNQKVKLYQLLAIHPFMKKKFYFDLLVRLCIDKRSLFNGPRYMYISHWFMFAFMYQYPYKKDLALPKFIDIYRATGYAR